MGEKLDHCKGAILQQTGWFFSPVAAGVSSTHFSRWSCHLQCPLSSASPPGSPDSLAGSTAVMQVVADIWSSFLPRKRNGCHCFFTQLSRDGWLSLLLLITEFFISRPNLLALIGYSGFDEIHAGRNPTTLILVSRVMLLLISLWSLGQKKY